MCAEAGIEPIVTTTAQWGDEMGKTPENTCCSPDDMQVDDMQTSLLFPLSNPYVLVACCPFLIRGNRLDDGAHQGGSD
jgi:hypothetical protein